jgi:hypothetical protein
MPQGKEEKQGILFLSNAYLLSNPFASLTGEHFSRRPEGTKTASGCSFHLPSQQALGFSPDQTRFCKEGHGVAFLPDNAPSFSLPGSWRC